MYRTQTYVNTHVHINNVHIYMQRSIHLTLRTARSASMGEVLRYR